jgi:hypothetical protein
MKAWLQSREKIPEGHTIGRRAVDILRYKLPRSWLTQPSGHDSDYGIDLHVEVVKDGSHTGTDFNVQVKGTSDIAESSKKRRIYLKQTTLSYLLNKVSPTILVLCDVQRERIYYTWLQVAIDSLTTRRTRNSISIEIDFGTELDSNFEERAIHFLEEYYGPIFIGLKNPAKIQHLTYGSFHVAQTFESLSYAYTLGLQSLLKERGAIYMEQSSEELSWAATWAVQALGLFCPLFKKFLEIYEDKYFFAESVADKQLIQLYQELRTALNSFLPVADIENEGGKNVISAGDFMLFKSDSRKLWEKSPEILYRLQALAEKLRELVLLAWKLEKREVKIELATPP